MFEFVFTQMAKANTQSCNKFDFSMIFTIKNIIRGWPDKFQDVVFKCTKASNISNVGQDSSTGQKVREKTNFWKSYVLFWKGICFHYF